MRPSTKPVAIVDPHFRKMDEIFSPDYKRQFYDLVDVVWGLDEPIPDQEFMGALPNAEIILCTGWRYGDVLPRAKSLKAIIEVAGAFPLGLDYGYCQQNVVRVLSAAPAFARQVAEMCLALALDASREVSYGDRAMRSGNERYLHEGNQSTFMLFDQPVGMIGFGNIARVLQKLITPFNVEIMAYDPWLSAGYLGQLGVQAVELETLLTRARLIFVLAAPSKENQAMLSREMLALIQANAVLVLASRAHVVDFDALTDLVLAGQFKLATDVFPTEPLQADHPIRKAEHAVLSAHRAGSVKEGLWEIGEMVVHDLEAILQGLPPRRLQNAEPELSGLYTTNRARSPEE